MNTETIKRIYSIASDSQDRVRIASNSAQKKTLNKLLTRVAVRRRFG